MLQTAEYRNGMHVVSPLSLNTEEEQIDSPDRSSDAIPVSSTLVDSNSLPVSSVSASPPPTPPESATTSAPITSSVSVSLSPTSSSAEPLPIRTVPTPPLRQWRLTRSGLVEISASNPAMGGFLDKPKTAKSNITGEGKDIRYAVASMQGWRVDMEDAHVVEISMGERDPYKDWSFFAVFDGHAGNLAADQSAEKILKTLLHTDEFIKATELLTENGGDLNEKVTSHLETGIKSGFLKLDEIIRKNDSDHSGTTAVCAILTPTHIIVANLGEIHLEPKVFLFFSGNVHLECALKGDSRAVLCREGESSFHTIDHKPYHDKERERIVGAGGSVMIQRINGSLAVSRALGDFEYKAVPNLGPTKQLVSCEPDVYFLQRHPDKDRFLVLACDGIYDVMENEELCDFVENRLEVSHELDSVANQVLDACLLRGSRDNMTLILVCFPNAPKIDEVKLQNETLWVEAMRKVIREIVDKETSSDDWKQENQMSVSWVMRQIPTVEMPGTPATHRLSSLVDSYLTEKNIEHYH